MSNHRMTAGRAFTGVLPEIFNVDDSPKKWDIDGSGDYENIAGRIIKVTVDSIDGTGWVEDSPSELSFIYITKRISL